MIYEIRNYHYNPKFIKGYRQWAVDLAVPHIKANLDLVGFWINVGEAIEIGGKPQDDLGSATVTWIIRWPDVETRHREFGRVFGSPAWQAIMDQNPGRENYLRTESKFAELIEG